MSKQTGGLRGNDHTEQPPARVLFSYVEVTGSKSDTINEVKRNQTIINRDGTGSGREKAHRSAKCQTQKLREIV